MAWPTPQEYNEALQGPQISFSDTELRSGRPELDALQLPRARSGTFATVYKVRCGQRDWAVRCFLREFSDQEERYAAIHEHLERVRLPHMALFQFLRRGILVRGQWYPILKMEWLTGDSLESYVKKNLRSPAVIRGVAVHWLQMIAALQRACITHGDLQHGNVLIINGQIRLIDYDGMYVPALAGRGSHEVGHRNYQHPGRSESHFGPNVDNFSAWVIGLALIALSADPGLWDRFGGGEESLLFRREDFEHPESSALLRALRTLPDERTRLVAQLFESLLHRPPDQIPSLDGNLISAQPAAAGASSGDSWIKDHLPSSAARAKSTDAQSQAPTFANLAWIFDWSEEAAPARDIWFTNSPMLEQLLLLVSAVLASAALVGGVQTALAPYGLAIALLVAMNVALLVVRYRADPIMDQVKDLRARMRKVDNELDRAAGEFETAKQEKQVALKEQDQRREQVSAQQLALERQQQLDVERVEASLRASRDALDQRWQAVRQAEAQGVQSVQSDLGVRIAAMKSESSGLRTKEADKVNSTLGRVQSRHIESHLKSHDIRTAWIPGVGATFKARLMARGFTTAFNVHYHSVLSVKGIGHTRAAAIHSWRTAIEAKANQTMPTALPSVVLAMIRAQYEGRQQQLCRDIAVLEQRLRNEESSIRSRSEAQRTVIEKERAQLDDRRNRETAILLTGYRPKYDSLKQLSLKLTSDTRDKLRSTDERIQKVTGQLSAIHFSKERVRREGASIAHLSFRSYLKMVLLGSKSA